MEFCLSNPSSKLHNFIIKFGFEDDGFSEGITSSVDGGLIIDCNDSSSEELALIC